MAVRVHPEYLKAQQLPDDVRTAAFWDERLESIRDHELHLGRNGTVILKFWLNVSKEEQRKRFLARLDEPEKHWKFSTGDVRERRYWDAYMSAYEEAVSGTSRSWAPWYAVPADDKHYMRLRVAEIVVNSLKSLDLKHPTIDRAERAQFAEMRRLLTKDSL